MKTKTKLIQEKQNLKKKVKQLNEESVKMTTKWLEEKQDYENQLQQLKQDTAKTEMKWQEEKREFEMQIQQLKQEATKTEMKWKEEKQEFEMQLQQLKKETAKNKMKWQEEKNEYETQLQHLKQDAAKTEMKWQEQNRENANQVQHLKQEVVAKPEMNQQEVNHCYGKQLLLNEEVSKISMGLQEENRLLENQSHQLENQTLKTTMKLQGEKLAHNTLVQRELRKDLDKLQQKEHNFKETERLKLKVQIFCSQESHLENNIMEEFALLLKKEMCQEDLELKLLRQSDISEIEPTELLLVLCMSLHAPGSEIQKALKGIHATRKTAVIMIHLREPHALPTIPSKSKVKEEIRTCVGGIFDMAFLRDRDDGLYECPMNRRNVCEIISFTKSF